MKAIALLKDLLKALLIGLIAAAALGLVLFAGGWLFGGMTLSNGLEAAKDGLLLLFSLGLLIIAGMLMIKGKKEERINTKGSWKNHFSVIGIKTAAGMVCIGLLAVAVLADALLRLLNG